MSTTTSLETFKSLVAQLRTLLSDIESEVSVTIESRDPLHVSSGQAIRSAEHLVAACRKFGQLSDELASYAADPSDHVAGVAGGFHESNALKVVSELHIANTLGNQELPLAVLATTVGADAVRLREFQTQYKW